MSLHINSRASAKGAITLAIMFLAPIGIVGLVLGTLITYVPVSIYRTLKDPKRSVADKIGIPLMLLAVGGIYGGMIGLITARMWGQALHQWNIPGLVALLINAAFVIKGMMFGYDRAE